MCNYAVKLCMCTEQIILHVCETSSVLLNGRAQFASQRDSAKKNRQGKRVVEARDSTQPLLLSTPSESELPGESHINTSVHLCVYVCMHV